MCFKSELECIWVFKDHFDLWIYGLYVLWSFSNLVSFIKHVFFVVTWMLSQTLTQWMLICHFHHYPVWVGSVGGGVLYCAWSFKDPHYLHFVALLSFRVLKSSTSPWIQSAVQRMWTNECRRMGREIFMGPHCVNRIQLHSALASLSSWLYIATIELWSISALRGKANDFVKN